METTKTYWQKQCETMLELDPTASQRSFIASVLSMVERNPECYPTVAQRSILKSILGHLERKQLSDVERIALEYSGRVH